MISAAFACPSSTSDRHLHRLESARSEIRHAKGTRQFFLVRFFPLPKTNSAAAARRIGRKPIAGRYQSRDDYLQKFSAAAKKLADDRFLLQDDIPGADQTWCEEWDYITK